MGIKRKEGEDDRIRHRRQRMKMIGKRKDGRGKVIDRVIEIETEIIANEIVIAIKIEIVKTDRINHPNETKKKVIAPKITNLKNIKAKARAKNHHRRVNQNVVANHIRKSQTVKMPMKRKIKRKEGEGDRIRHRRRRMKMIEKREDGRGKAIDRVIEIETEIIANVIAIKIENVKTDRINHPSGRKRKVAIARSK